MFAKQETHQTAICMITAKKIVPGNQQSRIQNNSRVGCNLSTRTHNGIDSIFRGCFENTNLAYRHPRQPQLLAYSTLTTYVRVQLSLTEYFCVDSLRQAADTGSFYPLLAGWKREILQLSYIISTLYLFTCFVWAQYLQPWVGLSE